jgi:glycosyltransferase involved in cell wall biosynthesis
VDVALVFPGCHRRGGVERSVWELARHWSQAHDVTVYAADVDREALPTSVAVVPVHPVRAPGPLAPWAFARASRAALAGHGHDHVVTFGIEAAPGLGDVLWVNSVHRAWLERRGEAAHDGLRQSAWRRLLPHHQVLLGLERRYFRVPGPAPVRRVVGVADAVGRDLVRLYDVPASLVATVHNGYDPTEFHPHRPDDRRSVRAELGLPDDAVVLLVVANELARKGFLVVVEAAARLADPRVHVLLVGRADPAAYAPQIAAAGMARRVHWAGSRSDMGRVHAASDLFVLPTTYEAFCLAIVEALASGLPVVTTTVPGAGDLIRPGTNGLLQHAPRDVDELAGLLRQGLDSDTRARWAAAAPSSVSHVTWSALAARAAHLLEGLPSLQGGDRG